MRFLLRVLIQVGLIIGGFAILSIDPSRLPWYYRPKLMASLAFFFVLIIELPSKIFSPSPERDKFQDAIAFSLAASSVGTLGAWSKSVWFVPYDIFVHFIIPFLMFVSALNLFSTVYAWPKKKTGVILFVVIAVIGIIWEYIEYWLYARYGVGYFGKLFDWDSITDIAANTAGLLAGAAFAAYRTKIAKIIQGRP
ncbi:MAG: hypothetical protein UW43_C0004G0039 [Candidatus Yanofskybacteria bacterium GW2011_GWA1_44_21]|uniref:VanZ-like domain-containing protein n=2 Tax=Candidatus Yanofskyibacteriota TaxID=1752733 RepID=A0A1F8H1E5_9BACT|nr:MAG: hypothetical protein UW14_C0005G0025 [Candidatus Yanofskybacteria bacterium GW2011_GWA2_44_10]KKT50607.1 MAG: hypothetical protein UW43_C0004G0039 [Candidatus Yanofskybacteria bacterium GW2011_GWA1_44_21]KKT90121.1 MAG: hypothetical protein UW90_C0006G0021 [Candidatus Yanofskybacteria bacterium GW2011_GWB1_45_11]OGN02786.1 MAG: hypothetical protein A2657_01425 [Candidatus Yanofskybacteria bacterium RIFCSPHIGHO2_01_FULL_44_110b]OGN14659.1 MAG: hypothetical protein A3C01_03170 [Candidatus